MTLGGTTRHELKCSDCGAPLSRMKALRVEHAGDVGKPKGKKAKTTSLPYEKPKKKKKKSKGMAHRLFDAAEDIFDLFD